MDRQIVLDVNLGFGNDYDQLSAPESNTILSFLNRKIKARALKNNQENSASTVAQQERTSVPDVSSSQDEITIIATGNSRNSQNIKSSTKKSGFKSAKLHETSLLSAVSTSDDEENIIPIRHIAKKTEDFGLDADEGSQQVKQIKNLSSKNPTHHNSSSTSKVATSSSSSSTSCMPTFRFLNFRSTEENWVMYTIEITNANGEKWRFESRYSLLKIFEEKLGEEIKGEKLPEFPGKKWFGNLSDEFIKERMISIERFMNAAFRNNNVQKTKIFKEFLKQSRENCIDF